jgi:general L-amino acid transport system substrate-binding protein
MEERIYMNRKRFTLIAVFMVLGLLLVACGGGEDVEVTRIVEVTRVVEVAGEAGPAEAITFAGGGDTLQTVLDRGELICGTPQGASPGFGFIEADGSYSGFDWEYCRVVAAAVLGDADAVVSRPNTATERFPLLQSGQIDMLSRQTTWTLSRDTSLGFNFVATTFYDGQGMMVRRADGITDLQGLEGGTVCVLAGTTTEKNLATVMSSLGINYEAVVFNDTIDTRNAYDEGRCDGYTTDKSGLISAQPTLKDPEENIILEATMSKEPLGPLVRHGDDNWFDIVQWSTFCTMQAEEKGVTSQNVDEMLGSDDPEILSLLGVENDLGQMMGLDNDFCYQIIKQVGNYEEIFLKHLGPDSDFAFDLPRGVNALWTEGGLIYSPPFR